MLSLLSLGSKNISTTEVFYFYYTKLCLVKKNILDFTSWLYSGTNASNIWIECCNTFFSLLTTLYTDLFWDIGMDLKFETPASSSHIKGDFLLSWRTFTCNPVVCGYKKCHKRALSYFSHNLYTVQWKKTINYFWHCSRCKGRGFESHPSNMPLFFVYSANTHRCIWVKPKWILLL